MAGAYQGVAGSWERKWRGKTQMDTFPGDTQSHPLQPLYMASFSLWIQKKTYEIGLMWLSTQQMVSRCPAHALSTGTIIPLLLSFISFKNSTCLCTVYWWFLIALSFSHTHTHEIFEMILKNTGNRAKYINKLYYTYIYIVKQTSGTTMKNQYNKLQNNTNSI